MAEVNLTLGDPIEVKVTPAEGATNVSVASAPQNVVQVQAAIATNGLQGADGVGVPAGGDEGQALVKINDTDYQTQWAFIDKLHINVINNTGATIPAGSVVYASGLHANSVEIDLADASDSSKMPAIGFTYEDMEDGDSGDVISAGFLNQNITGVTGAAVGKTMYVSESTPGSVTMVKPSGSSNLVQNVGVILKANNPGTNIQKFKVSAIDRTNDIPNLDSGHFFLGGATNTTSPYELPISSPTNGQLLRANASGNLEFVDTNQITKNVGVSNLTTTETTRNLDIIEDGHLNIRDAQNDTIFYIDEATKRVGINTTTLDKDAALFVNGNVLFKDDSTIGVEGSQEFNIGKIGDASGVATVNVTGDLNVTGNCTIDTNLKFGSAGNQLLAYPGTFAFGRNGSSATSYQFNGDVTNVSFENTGDVNLKNASGLKIFNGSTNNIAIQAPTLSGSYTLTLPTTSGTDGYVLKTDGSGTTSWVDVTAVSDAILDADFDDEDSGLMKKTGAGTYAIATADTDYQSVLPDGPFQTGDKDKLDLITVNAAVILDDAVLTTDTDISEADFVVDEDEMESDSATKVPTQQSVKAYVDSHVKTAIYSDASDNPQLAAGITAGEVRTLIGAIDDYTVTEADVTNAGALMDSEVTNLNQVKAFDSSDYATASQGTKADNALPKAGGQMTGSITFSGAQTVDGRDLSADGAKLDNIEANADVTDTANVTAAGALMDSEVTNLQDVKDFDPSDYATAAQGTAADAALPKTGGTMTGTITFAASQQFDGRDVSADGARLDTMEDNADVTDAANVAAAGAVMNSGNESIDGVKTFTSTISGSIDGNAATVTNGVYTTSSVTALSDVSDAGSGIIMSAGERTKLTNIEALADVTDSANVVSSLVSATSIDSGDQGTIKTNLGITDAADTVRTVKTTDGAVTTTLESSEELNLTAGTNIAITEAAGVVTIGTEGVITSVSADSTPALGGTLDASGYNIEDVANINVGSQIRHEGDTHTFIEFPDLGDRFKVVTGNTEKLFIGPAEVEINGASGNVDFRVRGDNTADLFFVDASTDRVGIKTVTPSEALDVDGNIKVGGTINVNGNFTIPSTDGDANQVLQTNGSGTLSWVDLPAAYGDSDVNAHLSGGTGINYNNGTISISASTNDLSDVSSSGTADGQILIYDAGSNSYDPANLTEGDNITITNGAGTITIAATDTGISNVQADSTPALGGNLNVNDFHIVSDASEHITIEAGSGGDVNIDGEPVNIKHAGTTRLATSGTGVDVTGHLDMSDDDEIRLGTDNDFRITYDSTAEDGELRAETIALKGSNDENMLRANTDGAVSLYHNASRKFDTTAYGVSVTGYAAATGYSTDFSSALTAVGNHRGATLVEGVYSSGSITNGKVYQMGLTAWAEGHADGEATASGMLAIATSTSASGKFVTKGLVKVLDIKGGSPSKGDIVYLSEDAAESGYVTVDRPSADGDIVRIVGYVVNSTADMIYFDPSPDFIEVA